MVFGISIKKESGGGSSQISEVGGSGTPPASPAPATAIVKRKRPGPASKTLKRKKNTDEHEGRKPKVLELESSSSSVLPPVKEEQCVVCSHPVTQENMWDNEEKIKKITNFCEAMVGKELKDSYGDLSGEENPLCGDCEDHVCKIWKVEEQIREAGLKKTAMVSEIAKKILDGVNSSTASAAATDQRAALGKLIVEGCRRKVQLRLSDDVQKTENTTGEESDATYHSLPPTTPEISGLGLAIKNEVVEKKDDESMEVDSSEDDMGTPCNADLDTVGMEEGETSFFEEEEDHKLGETALLEKDEEDVSRAATPKQSNDDVITSDLDDTEADNTLSQGSQDNLESLTIAGNGDVDGTNLEAVENQDSKLEVEQSHNAEQGPAEDSKENTPDDGLLPVDNDSKKETGEKMIFVKSRRIARKRTGGHFPMKVKVTCSPSQKSEATSAASSVVGSLKTRSVGDKDESESSLFPYPVPVNPEFMLSKEKMACVTLATSKAIIKQLGGSVSSTRDEYDAGSFGLVAERLGSNEKVLCSIAAGKFILKMSYLLESRKAGKFLPIKKEFLWREEDAKQAEKEEKKLGKASYNWLIAQRQRGENGAMFGKKFFLLPTTAQRLQVSKHMIQAAGGEVVETREEATVIIKDGQPPKKSKGGVPIKNSSSLYKMIVSEPVK